MAYQGITPESTSSETTFGLENAKLFMKIGQVCQQLLLTVLNKAQAWHIPLVRGMGSVQITERSLVLGSEWLEECIQAPPLSVYVMLGNLLNLSEP